MPRSRLLNPDGDVVGYLDGSHSHETVFRLAYGLDAADMVTAVLEGDLWTLSALVLSESPTGPVTRDFPFSLKEGTVPVVQVEASLLELAVLDLWDRGWSLEQVVDQGA